jgi:hypothetical protein
VVYRVVRLMVVLVALLLVAGGVSAKGGFEATVYDDQLDLRADGAPLLSVLEEIAEQAGLDLQVYGDPDTEPTVTGVLEDVPLEAALERLLGGNYLVTFDQNSRITGVLVVLRPESVMLGGEPGLAESTEDADDESVPASLEAEIQKLHRDFSRELLGGARTPTGAPSAVDVRAVQDELKERLDDLTRQVQETLRPR